jgi:hypothetical protein
VGVEAHRAGLQFTGDPADGDGVEAFVIGDGHRRPDDPLAGQRPGLRLVLGLANPE